MRRCVLSQPIAVMLLASYLSACHYYATPGPMGPEAHMTQEQPSKVRVTLTDARQVTLTSPWITSDSIGGIAEAGPTKWDDELGSWVRGVSAPWAASREQVASIEIHRVDPVATTALVVLAAGVILVGIVVIAVVIPCSQDVCD